MASFRVLSPPHLTHYYPILLSLLLKSSALNYSFCVLSAAKPLLLLSFPTLFPKRSFLPHPSFPPRSLQDHSHSLLRLSAFDSLKTNEVNSKEILRLLEAREDSGGLAQGALHGRKRRQGKWASLWLPSWEFKNVDMHIHSKVQSRAIICIAYWSRCSSEPYFESNSIARNVCEYYFTLCRVSGVVV